ncbi:Hypp6375 [Branchiostoma lanceolatum]|uniref:Hypp6375 protein n=1 Tax=Branchiostoma lanceolatum TaxID=7740 RepID=A0A8J9YTR1_BRALA|nr:Hypp6375 [Branchiostoma lanceolatum]
MANTTATSPSISQSAVAMTTTPSSSDGAAQGMLGGEAIAAIVCASFIFVLLILAGVVAILRAVKKNKNTVQPEHGDKNTLIVEDDGANDPGGLNSNDAANPGNGNIRVP